MGAKTICRGRRGYTLWNAVVAWLITNNVVVPLPSSLFVAVFNYLQESQNYICFRQRFWNNGKSSRRRNWHETLSINHSQHRWISWTILKQWVNILLRAKCHEPFLNLKISGLFSLCNASKSILKCLKYIHMTCNPNFSPKVSLWATRWRWWWLNLEKRICANHDWSEYLHFPVLL